MKAFFIMAVLLLITACTKIEEPVPTQTSTYSNLSQTENVAWNLSQGGYLVFYPPNETIIREEDYTQLVVLTGVFLNTGKTQISLGNYKVALIDDQGRQYEHDPSSCYEYETKEAETFSQYIIKLPPDIPIAGFFCFTTAKGAPKFFYFTPDEYDWQPTTIDLTQ